MSGGTSHFYYGALKIDPICIVCNILYFEFHFHVFTIHSGGLLVLTTIYYIWR